MPLQTHAKHVAIVGAGIAGLTAAVELARFNIDITLLEKAPVPGGHAAQLSCKAAPDCVKCGACLVHEKLRKTTGHERINLLTGTQVIETRWEQRISMEYSCHSAELDDDRHLDAIDADAVLVTAGFSPFNPASKPYGYERFENVITSLEAEHRLQKQGFLSRPSDDRAAQRVAFVQCVGSRDATLGHPWCSKICCGSSLRMARLIQARQNDVESTFFYIDVQTFGKDFAVQFPLFTEEVKMIRAIPGDIMGCPNGELKVTYFDTFQRKAAESHFDLVVLSVGLTPSPDNADLAKIFGLHQDNDGFLRGQEEVDGHHGKAVFTAGTSQGPMSIAESIGSAERAAWEIAQYLHLGRPSYAPVTG